MRPQEEDIATLFKKSLPSAQREEEAGKRVFYRLLLAKTESAEISLPTDDEDDFSSIPRSRFSLAVSLPAVASLLFIVVLTSVLWRTAGSLPSARPPANLVRNGESVRADGPDSRMLALPDGSQVEMRSQSELQIDHAADGLHIRLYAGSIIVAAAKQGVGHLYVETKDAMVSVVGTVFLVSVEQTGSRAGVIEGVVNVQHDAISQKLLPGQQTATDPAMQPVPLEVQVAWSRNAAIYVAMLRQLVQAPKRPAPTASAAPPQNRPAAPSQSPREPDSLLILGPANNEAARGQRSPASTPETERTLEQAFTSREAIPDLPFLAVTNYFQFNRAEYLVPVTLKIPGSQLAGSESAKRVFLDIVGQVKDDYGTIAARLRDGVDIRLSEETAKVLPSRQITYDARFTLLAGRYFIKFLVRDGITGRMGTYETTVVIPNLNKEGQNSLPISSVVLSGELINLDDPLSNLMASPTISADSRRTADPLFIEGKKLIPSGTRTFSNRRDLLVFLEAYEPGTSASEPLTVSVTLYRGQTKVRETPPLTVKDGSVNRQIRTLPVRLNVPLAGLPVGAYDCEVTVFNSATQKAAVWRSPINVVN
jgi:ferric-dicitrate binding protein FerR (iron transport regulator)